MDSPHNSRTSSTPAVASSLRPRNRRLISGLDDEPADGLQSISSARIASPLPSPYESRAASPIPCKHLSRLASSNPARQTSDLDSSRPGAGLGPVNGKEPSGSLSALWGSSWTSLQGLASDLLGSNTTAAAKDKSVRTRKPLEATHRRSATSVPPVQWGPSTSTTASHRIGAGSKEGREALVRSKKREDLLRANGHAYTDVAGRFKRRTSDDRASVSAPPGENEDREALVYIHRVRPEDTLPGITIKYNCQAATLRKANRMWPNDSIQSRKTIVLPVDACGVKGRRISAPEGGDGKRAARASVGMPGPGAGGVGDLIELADAFEIGGEDDDDEEEQRGRQGSAVMQSPVESTRGLSRVQEDSGLRERTRSGGGLNRRNREKGD
ncbi:hypothetical protein LTR39_000393 [Cryomyces antarcticus]|nr:hypothetical protein LTR39_000393 [Cryomyces antarcticus]